MNELALISIGAVIGISLSLIAVIAYCLWTVASGIRRDTNACLTKVSDSITAQTRIVHQLLADVTLAMSRMDAERLYEASLAVQRSAKSLSAQIATLQKVVFAQPASPAIDLSDPLATMNDEAEEDARQFAEQRRWADPLAGLTEEEKAQRTAEFFQRRQGSGMSRFGSAPPTAGAGAYASLIEEAQSRIPAAQPPQDFPDANGDEDLDLSGKGELGE